MKNLISIDCTQENPKGWSYVEAGTVRGIYLPLIKGKTKVQKRVVPRRGKGSTFLTEIFQQGQGTGHLGKPTPNSFEDQEKRDGSEGTRQIEL